MVFSDIGDPVIPRGNIKITQRAVYRRVFLSRINRFKSAEQIGYRKNISVSEQTLQQTYAARVGKIGAFHKARKAARVLISVNRTDAVCGTFVLFACVIALTVVAKVIARN